METIKKVGSTIWFWIKKIGLIIWLWSKKQVVFFIAILALSIWFGFYEMSKLIGTETFPIGYFQKIPFGIVVACVGLGTAFAWIKFGLPEVWDTLSHKTEGGVNSITEWQHVLVSLFWVFIIIVSFLIGVIAL